MRRFLLTTAISFTILSALAAAMQTWFPMTQYSEGFILAEFAVCAAVSGAVYFLEGIIEGEWKIFWVSTGLGTGAADAVLMPAGLLRADWVSVFISVGLSAAVCALTSAALLLMDREEDMRINAEIQDRRRQ